MTSKRKRLLLPLGLWPGPVRALTALTCSALLSLAAIVFVVALSFAGATARCGACFAEAASVVAEA